MFQTPLLPGGFSSRVVPPGPSCVPPLSSPGPPPLRHDTVPTTTLCAQSPSPNTTQSLSEVPTSAGSPGRGPASSTSPGPSPGSPLQLTPVLVPSQISRLAEAAQNLIRSLPHLEPKANNTKRKACKDLETVLSMAEDDPLRMDQIRKYAAIYGRFDCKRKPEKPLTLHEVSVNEAAAQICRLVPALLTRRDELFPLARQVVRDSGYHYSKGHSKSYSVSHGARSLYTNGDHGAKRPRLDLSQSLSDLGDDSIRHRRQERLEQIADELRGMSERTEELLGMSVREPGDLPAIHFQLEALQARQAQLLLEQGELVKQNQQAHPSLYFRRSSSCGQVSSSFDSERQDTDDTDSQLSFSNASSPSQEVGDSRDSLTREADAADPTSPKKPKQVKREAEVVILN
ncbi:hypothetical protein J6590_050807 [Homalodisca vitripennis]|nr:hypothetical protein J6590_050807 [Homalodisca vitripennis]